jgi:hypothetical protein
VAGYLHPGYAASLAEWGAPTELPRSGGWFLKRPIPGIEAWDGMGCYPFLACRDWSALGSDLEGLKGELVSFVAAPDPFGDYTVAQLVAAFGDQVVKFKDHHVADLRRPLDSFLSKRRRQRADRALRIVDVEFSEQPLQHLDAWMEVFSHSAEQFGLRGLRAFSREAFRQQLALPGAAMSLARQGSELVAAHIQMVHGGVAYAHMAAAKPAAGTIGAAAALYYAELMYYAGKVDWIDWGGEAGLSTSGSLSTFKQGWSTGVRPAYICGRILDRPLYEQLALAAGARGGYFPAYRAGEFG